MATRKTNKQAGGGKKELAIAGIKRKEKANQVVRELKMTHCTSEEREAPHERTVCYYYATDLICLLHCRVKSWVYFSLLPRGGQNS